VVLNTQAAAELQQSAQMEIHLLLVLTAVLVLTLLQRGQPLLLLVLADIMQAAVAEQVHQQVAQGEQAAELMEHQAFQQQLQQIWAVAVAVLILVMEAMAVLELLLSNTQTQTH
jgi:hypothetical protein